MCRVQNDDLTAAAITDLLVGPAPALEDLFRDPAVRKRVGEWISQAMDRPRRHKRSLNIKTRFKPRP
jgi:hypothetical protein